VPIEESTPAALTIPELRDVYTRLEPLYGIWELLGTGKARRAALQFARVSNGESVLEVAVGPGTALTQLAGANPLGTTVGVDLTPAMLRRTTRLLQHLGRQRPPLCEADGRLLPFDAGTFDLIFSAYMLDALGVSDIEKAIAEMRRILKPAGRLVLLHLSSSDRRFNLAWGILYWLVPHLLGGCRPIRLASYVSDAGLEILELHQIREWGIPLEIVVASYR